MDIAPGIFTKSGKFIPPVWVFIIQRVGFIQCWNANYKHCFVRRPDICFLEADVGVFYLRHHDETFREALVASLNKMNLPFEETISKIKLTSLGADLHVAVASWMGTAQLRIKQTQHQKIAGEIAAEMKEYFSSHPVKVNNISFIVNLILGILMFILLAIMIPVFLR